MPSEPDLTKRSLPMKALQLTFEAYSPRWGHADRYHVHMTEKEMKVSQGAFISTCTQKHGEDPQWKASDGFDGEHALIRLFTNEAIHPPEIVPVAMEWAWQRWRDGEVTDQDVEAGLKDLFDWIEHTARWKWKTE